MHLFARLAVGFMDSHCCASESRAGLSVLVELSQWVGIEEVLFSVAMATCLRDGSDFALARRSGGCADWMVNYSRRPLFSS